MSCVKNITLDTFPKQGKLLNARVTVFFHYNTSKTIGGQIVRDDAEDPFVAIIKLDNGRYVRTVECQFSLHHT